MNRDRAHTSRPTLLRLLDVALDDFGAELSKRVAAAGFPDIRMSHGCVFGNIEPDGSRLTELADRAGMTKQTVGEVASDLEQRGYLERVPDPTDGRAKIIRLTDRGRLARTVGGRLIDDIECEWGERFGVERVGALREVLESITGADSAGVPV